MPNSHTPSFTHTPHTIDTNTHIYTHSFIYSPIDLLTLTHPHTHCQYRRPKAPPPSSHIAATQSCVLVPDARRNLGQVQGIAMPSAFYRGCATPTHPQVYHRIHLLERNTIKSTRKIRRQRLLTGNRVCGLPTRQVAWRHCSECLHRCGAQGKAASLGGKGVGMVHCRYIIRVRYPTSKISLSKASTTASRQEFIHSHLTSPHTQRHKTPRRALPTNNVPSTQATPLKRVQLL